MSEQFGESRSGMIEGFECVRDSSFILPPSSGHGEGNGGHPIASSSEALRRI